MNAHSGLRKCHSTRAEDIRGQPLHVDRVWPSTLLCDRVMEQLKRAKHRFADCQLVCPGPGHFIPLPNLPATVNAIIHPVTKTEIDLGGDPEYTARAAVDSWAYILKFLHAALRQSSRLRTPKAIRWDLETAFWFSASRRSPPPPRRQRWVFSPATPRIWDSTPK